MKLNGRMRPRMARHSPPADAPSAGLSTQRPRTSGADLTVGGATVGWLAITITAHATRLADNAGWLAVSIVLSALMAATATLVLVQRMLFLGSDAPEPARPAKQRAAFLVVSVACVGFALAVFQLSLPVDIAAVATATLFVLSVLVTSRSTGSTLRILVIGRDQAFLDHMLASALRRTPHVTTRLVEEFPRDASGAPPLGAIAMFHEIAVQGTLCNSMRGLIRAVQPASARIIVVLEPDARSYRDRRVLRAWVEPFNQPLSRIERFAKRVVDLVVGLSLLVLTAPAILVALIAIRLETPGSPLFRQTRRGIDGRLFTLFKLRTMYADADDAPHRVYAGALIRGEAALQDGIYKLKSDPRVTRVGRVLRRLSLDELPQLLNVVLGGMSMVGPRPPLPNETELYDGFAWQRLRVKPGLTGPWQVSGRSRLTFEQMVELDVRYWAEWTLRKDLAILARTPLALVAFSETA